VSNYGDWQQITYHNGVNGIPPIYPMSYPDLERRAQEALPADLWSYVAGGAGDERTQNANVAAFNRWGLMPRMLRGAAERDLSVELFGRRLPTPLLLAPVATLGPCGPDGHGDIATAEASAATGVPMIASTLADDTLEDVADATGRTPAWFQLYPPKDRELTKSFVKRAEAAGYEVMVVTVDTTTLGWRPRDLARGTYPQVQGQCLANYFVDPVFRATLTKPPEEDRQAATDQWARTFGDPALSWDDLDWLRSLTTLPLLIKGICHPDDARRAIDAGADGIYCSNHGGRQANTGLPALDCLPDVVDACGDIPVIFDSGVRTGADVIKALALGARAVAVGRPYAYGLAVGGRKGIQHVLRCLLAEADLIMGNNGYPRIADLTRDSLRRVDC
jgi:lactate 2-monooxygenase